MKRVVLKVFPKFLRWERLRICDCESPWPTTWHMHVRIRTHLDQDELLEVIRRENCASRKGSVERALELAVPWFPLLQRGSDTTSPSLLGGLNERMPMGPG